jgi:hypothetical protein
MDREHREYFTSWRAQHKSDERFHETKCRFVTFYQDNFFNLFYVFNIFSYEFFVKKR